MLLHFRFFISGRIQVPKTVHNFKIGPGLPELLSYYLE
jgi:hypothetical protein